MKLKMMITVLFVIIAATNVHAGGLTFVPFGGLSLPVGEAGVNWQAGYAFGLDGIKVRSDPINYGVRISVQRWEPNAKEMLKTGGRNLVVNRSLGWKAAGELAALAQWKPPSGILNRLNMQVEGSLGLAYIQQDDVDVRGFYPSPTTALNREIFRSGSSMFAPELSIGLSMDILNVVRPSVKYQHLIADETMGIVLFGIGLLPK
jgi:hypothetical protein